MVLRRPSIDEQSGGNEQAPRNHHRNAKLGLANAIVLSSKPPVYTIVQRRADLCAEKEANAQGNIVQAAFADGFLIFVRPEDWKGRQD